MDPVDFISVAMRLANRKNEADNRTAVGRAYYGAFHVALRFLIDCGVHFPRREMHAADIHRKVQYCLSESMNRDAMRVSDHLRGLREKRNEADYDLQSAAFRTPAVALKSLRVATEIVDGIRRCQNEPAAFLELRAKVREYARDVLRLTLQDD